MPFVKRALRWTRATRRLTYRKAQENTVSSICSAATLAVSAAALAVSTALLAQHACAADVDRGALLFQTCSACHSVLGDGIGPDINGIYGRKAATREGFKYSEAMKLSGIIWDEATLRAFIKKPQSVVKGTAMAFPGYEMPADVDDVIGYLKTLK
jgi:cytochrome c